MLCQFSQSVYQFQSGESAYFSRITEDVRSNNLEVLWYNMLPLKQDRLSIVLRCTYKLHKTCNFLCNYYYDIMTHCPAILEFSSTIGSMLLQNNQAFGGNVL